MHLLPKETPKFQTTSTWVNKNQTRLIQKLFAQLLFPILYTWHIYNRVIARYSFLSNHNIHKDSCGLHCWAPSRSFHPAQNQKPHDYINAVIWWKSRPSNRMSACPIPLTLTHSSEVSMSICEMLLCSHDEVHSSMIYTVTLKGTISKNNVYNKGKKVDLHKPECPWCGMSHNF